MVRISLLLLTAALAAMVVCAQPARGQSTSAAVAPVSPARAAELAKFENPRPYMAASTPGGTAWDAQYRSFIQTDANAASKGLPTHAESAEQVKADAALSAAKLQQHKGWILFIKNASQAYRPDEATEALKALYSDLVAMEFGVLPSPAATPAATLPFDGDARLVIHRDVVYGVDDAQAQRMDAYLVRSATPTPVLVEFHGGGWRRGGKSQFDEAYTGHLIDSIIGVGISVISVDYRMTPSYQLPAMTDDAARAVQFIRSRAAEWNIDPKRVVAMGGSAGAHLSAWVALHDELAEPTSADPVRRASSRLSAFVDLWGPVDLTRPNPVVMRTLPLRGEDFANAFIAACGCSAEAYVSDSAARQRLRAASPLFLVSHDDPPALIVHQGPVVTDRNHPPVHDMINDPHSWEQGVLLADAMEGAGIAVVRHISPTAGKDPSVDVPLILGFLKRHLGIGPR
jgi:acetyl esterase/lipase